MPEALAIDVGEWFHAQALAGRVSPRHWRRLASCSVLAFERARAALAGSDVRATWFVNGELARREAAALRALADAGHEIALAATPFAGHGAGERERAQREWLVALAAIEAATGRAVRGVRLPRPEGAGWWREWCAAQGLAYAVTGAGRAAQAFAGAAVPLALFPAWQLVPEQPALVGLPRAVFAAHYGELTRDPVLLQQRFADGGDPIARALAIDVGPAATREVPAAPAVVVGRDAVRLAIVVPLKDEAAGIASLAVELAAVERALADVAVCEFVLVDDGSVDDTWSLLRSHFAASPRHTLVQHATNRGVAAAIATGIAATAAPFVASIDGDLSYDPMELRAMLPPVLAGVDVVTASPYHARGGVKNVPGWRLLLSKTLSFAYRVLLGSPVRTWTSCFRVYRRAAVVDLPLANPGFLGTAELLVRVLRRGGRVAEHPCVLEARLFGFSKMKVLRTIGGHLRLLLAVAARRVR